MARARPVVIAAVVLVSLVTAFVARASEPLSAAPESGPPSYVAACLSLSVHELCPCFRQNAVEARSVQPLGVQGESGPPAFVAACLSQAAQQIGPCFRQEAAPPPGTPPSVSKCLALKTRSARIACFRALVPARLARCLALRTRQERTTCFKKLRRP